MLPYKGLSSDATCKFSLGGMVQPYIELWMLLVHTVVCRWPVGRLSRCALSNLDWLLWLSPRHEGCSSMHRPVCLLNLSGRQGCGCALWAADIPCYMWLCALRSCYNFEQPRTLCRCVAAGFPTPTSSWAAAMTSSRTSTRARLCCPRTNGTSRCGTAGQLGRCQQVVCGNVAAAAVSVRIAGAFQASWAGMLSLEF